MKIVKPTIGGAIASITKGIKQLEAVIANSTDAATRARQKIADADSEMRAAQADAEHASRIKGKLEELIA